jgi:hypothetical protein
LRSGATYTVVGSVTGGSVAGIDVATGTVAGGTSVEIGAGVATGGGVASSANMAGAVHSQSSVTTHRERRIMSGTCPLCSESTRASIPANLGVGGRREAHRMPVRKSSYYEPSVKTE